MMRELLVVKLQSGQEVVFEGTMIHGNPIAIHGMFLLSQPCDICLNPHKKIDSVFQLRCDTRRYAYVFDSGSEVLLGQIRYIEIQSD